MPTPKITGMGSETPSAIPNQHMMWDATPGPVTPSHETPAHETPGRIANSARRRWDETPRTERGIKC